MTKIEKLSRLMDEVPRVSLAQLPTPLQKLDNLSKELGGPQIYIKRDDLTGGLTFGGNKTRMMEYRMAPAVKQEADIIVTGFAIQSNHARQVAVAARKLGMDVLIVSRSADVTNSPEIQGNLLIDLLAGAKVKIVDVDPERQASVIKEEVKKLTEKGKQPYETGYSDEHLSAISYVGCYLELEQQFQEMGIKPDYLYVPSEGATQAGLTLANEYIQSSVEVRGINMVDWVSDVPGRIFKIANNASEALGLDFHLDKADITNFGEYVGEGYAKPTEECLNAIKTLASTEGVLLDPIYTGKGMSGLMDHIDNGLLTSDDTVVYLHTGGVPTLFCYNNEFEFNGLLNVKSH